MQKTKEKLKSNKLRQKTINHLKVNKHSEKNW